MHVFPASSRCLRVPAKSRKAKLEFSKSLWDAIMVAVTQELTSGSKIRRKELTDAAGAICAATSVLVRQDEFDNAMKNTSKANVVKRIHMMRQLLQEAAPPR